MLFSSINFLFVFLPIVLILYYVIPSRRLCNLLLLLASLVFYAWGEPVYVILMVFSTVCNYILGLDIHRHIRNGNEPAAKSSLVFTVAFNLFILGFFKYFGFLIDTFNGIFHASIPYKELALPIGISFYTFQTLSYIIDVYRGKVDVQRNYFRFALYVTMFPQLIAGPIVRYADIEEQLDSRRESPDLLAEGITRFITGLGKKVLLANSVGMIWTKVSAVPAENLSTLAAWVGIAAFTFQIYFDFSGYSDMAIGLGKMFGFEFLENFRYPYISASVTEFWRRWHISLGSWFREYVYIPFGGNRVSVGRHIRNILVVWMLTGLWHGAAWNFVVWGLFYGIFLLLEKYIWGGLLSKLPAFIGRIYTMIVVMIGWVFFASDKVGYAFRYIKAMFFGGASLADNVGLYYLRTNWILFIILILASLPLGVRVKEWLLAKTKYGAGVMTVCYVAVFFLSIAFLVTETYNPFLYFRF